MLMGLEELGLDKSELEKFKERYLLRMEWFSLPVLRKRKIDYSLRALNYINSPDKNIITVEDPVEYELKGINQIQVKTHIGLTFASCLRTILRQDPDIIMVGEIRDKKPQKLRYSRPSQDTWFFPLFIRTTQFP